MAAPIRIAVFQPMSTEGAGFDYRLLGLQSWLADRFSDVVQLEGASMLMTGPPDVERQLVGSAPWHDDHVYEILGAIQARFGVLTSFAMLGGRPHLASARLVERRRELPLHTVSRMKPERDIDEPPIMAHFLFCSVIRAIAVAPELPSWMEMFGTHDVRIASNYLTALGAHAACVEGLRFDEPELALRAALSGAFVGMQPAIALVPNLCASLRASGSASDELVEAMLGAAIEQLGHEPLGWGPVLRELGVASSRPLD